MGTGKFALLPVGFVGRRELVLLVAFVGRGELVLLLRLVGRVELVLLVEILGPGKFGLSVKLVDCCTFVVPVGIVGSEKPVGVLTLVLDPGCWVIGGGVEVVVTGVVALVEDGVGGGGVSIRFSNSSGDPDQNESAK